MPQPARYRVVLHHVLYKILELPKNAEIDDFFLTKGMHNIDQILALMTNLVLQRHVTPQKTRLRVPDDIILIVARRTYFDWFKQGDVTRHESVERNQ